jgi:propanediol dehydratase small subunit
MSCAFSGRALEEVTLAAAVAGELGADDIRIHPHVLCHQAQVAERHGNPQLAANLRRAAELTALKDEQLLEIYEALRPRRSTGEQLGALAERLDVVPAPACAALVREARDAYADRGLLK